MLGERVEELHLRRAELRWVAHAQDVARTFEGDEVGEVGAMVEDGDAVEEVDDLDAHVLIYISCASVNNSKHL